MRHGAESKPRPALPILIGAFSEAGLSVEKMLRNRVAWSF